MSIIDEQFLQKRLVGVREIVFDDDPDIVEGYALNLEGYELEIRTMLDTSALQIGCGQCWTDPPIDLEPGYIYNDVSHDEPFLRFLNKRFLKWRLLTNERHDWEGLMVTFDISEGLCFLSLDFSVSVLTVVGAQFSYES
ncbi:MAG: hypothetical protein ACMUIP_09530 [bacterium]